MREQTTGVPTRIEQGSSSHKYCHRTEWIQMPRLQSFIRLSLLCCEAETSCCDRFYCCGELWRWFPLVVVAAAASVRWTDGNYFSCPALWREHARSRL